MSDEAAAAAVRQSNADEASVETVIKKISLRTDDIRRMKRLASLFSDELGDDPKEIDILSFFLRRSFTVFLNSGEIEKKLSDIRGN